MAWGSSDAVWKNDKGALFTADKSIIDVSGDGSNNAGLANGAGRDLALSRISGLTINGLTIGGGTALVNHYTNFVIGGPGAQVFVANDFSDFAFAVENKIRVELGGDVIPEPSQFLPLVGGVFALWHFRRRKMKSQA